MLRYRLLVTDEPKERKRKQNAGEGSVFCAEENDSDDSEPTRTLLKRETGIFQILTSATRLVSQVARANIQR